MDLYSAFIVVPHAQGAQVRITQCYLQITPCLYLVSIHQMAHPQTELQTSSCSLLLIYLPRKDEMLTHAHMMRLCVCPHNNLCCRYQLFCLVVT